MRRIEKIYLYVCERSKKFSRIEIQDQAGITTAEIADVFQIQRTNASKDLNQLVREGLIVKAEGRPVKYRASGLDFAKNAATEGAEAPLVAVKVESGDIFQSVIGRMGSMKVPIEQAKAAILYPPQGLNCLITGATGSGKTHFAHLMFEFAKSQHLVGAHEELIVFNCADYAHNAELLMSHLFGYVAGAFTGASAAKAGLIEEADGGVLFLDEIHRLPPEGQEMIFYFMDHGRYNRLGETLKERTANVRIICATTEDTTSYLLNTFVRRIPISIQLPSFNQRQTAEKIDLIKLMVGMEAERIQRKILLTEDVVKALIGSVTYGNIGQLKSTIQLICARSFISQMNQAEMTITLDDLTEEVRQGLSQLADNRHFSAELAQSLAPVMEVLPSREASPVLDDDYELPYNLYELIDQKATLLREDGVDQESINQFIMTDINVQLKSFYQNHHLTFDTENKLAEIVDQEIIDLTREIYALADQRSPNSFQVNFMYAVSLHISSFFKRHQRGELDDLNQNSNIQKMVQEYPVEYGTALEIKELISRSFQIVIPEAEVEYLTVLLASLKKEKVLGQIGIVVAAHGKSTASSMVQVVKQLFGSKNLIAVDMPLEMKPRLALEEIVAAVEVVDNGSGVILLVDMGSLATFEGEIHRRTGIQVRTIDMVTTALVLEVARKTELLETDLNHLFSSLKNFRGYGNQQLPPESVTSGPTVPTAGQTRAIVAICASGQGTAQRMKELIESYLLQVGETDLLVIPLSVVDMAEKLQQLQREYHLLAITGIVDPQIGVPYLPLEQLFSGEAIDVLQDLVLENSLAQHTPLELDPTQSWEIVYNYLGEHFMYLNPAKVLPPFWEFAQALTTAFLPAPNEAFTINLIMHLGGMVERIIQQDCLTVEAGYESIFELAEFKQVAGYAQQLGTQLNLEIPLIEVYYLYQILNNTLATNRE